MSIKVFQPDPRKFRREVALTAVVYLIAAPLVYAAKAPDLPLVWGVSALLAGLPLVIGIPFYRAYVRGFDVIGVGPEGLLVTRPKGGFRLEWHEVARVYRFQEQLIVETAAPVRRETIHLHGHEHHEDAMFEAMREHARTLNLGILESLARFGGIVR